jgi:hypothetical protein
VSEEDAQESTARRILEEILEQLCESILSWHGGTEVLDPHPELTNLVTAFQEETLRNLGLSQEHGLEKTTLSFEFLMHHFNLSCLPDNSGSSQWFYSQTTRAVAFAEDADWLAFLNLRLIQMEFIISGDECWSFSTLGTHCAENFFGLVSQSSRRDDRFTRTVGIIAETKKCKRRSATFSPDAIMARNVRRAASGDDAEPVEIGLENTLLRLQTYGLTSRDLSPKGVATANLLYAQLHSNFPFNDKCVAKGRVRDDIRRKPTNFLSFL